MLSALRLFLNSLALLAALALVLLLGLDALALRELPWGHLLKGRQLAESGALPRFDNLLFSAPRAAFDASSWLWDLAAAKLVAWTPRAEALAELARRWPFPGSLPLQGPGRLRLLDALAWGLSAWALLAACFRRGARPFSAAAFTAAALLAALPDLEPGPGLWGLAAFASALWLMEGELWTAVFARWIWLIPLAALAVNLSPAAWALLPLAALWLLFGRGGAAPRLPFLAGASFLAVLLGALCLHPLGWSAALAGLGGLQASPLLPGAFGPRQGALALMAAAALLVPASAWTRGGRERWGRDAALLLAFGAAALFSRDALPYFLALAAPACASRFDAIAQALPSPLRALRWPLRLLALLALALWTLGGGWRGLRPPAPAPFPRQSVDFCRQHFPIANVLCPPEWTAPLAWQLAPGQRYALDGRPSPEPARRYALEQALRAEGDLASVLAQEGVDLCWLPRGSPLAAALATKLDWQPLAFDNAAVLYARSGGANAELVHKFAPRGLKPGLPARPFDEQRLAEAESDLEAGLAARPEMGVLYLYMGELWLARGREAKARATLEAGIRADPDFAQCYGRLADLRAAKGDLPAARSLYRLALERQEQPAWRRSLASLEEP